MKRNSWWMICFILVMMFSVSGCLENKTGEMYEKEQSATVNNQARLFQTQPPPALNWSLERDNISKRTTLWNNPNKVSYIYLINYGKVMAFYTIKGKVSSVNSQITNSEQIVWTRNGSVVLPSPSEDGSYGANGDAVFFFTTEGAYVEWRGDYMLADQPLKLSTQPELVRLIN